MQRVESVSLYSLMAKVEPRETVRKGAEGGFEGGFRRYEVAEMSPKEPSRRSVVLRQGCFQSFSDSLRR